MRAFIVRFTLAVLLTVSGWAATGAPFAGQVFQGISDPRSMAGLAVWYDTSDVTSMLVSVGVNPTTGQAVKLIADKSGNSSTNCLVLNGVAGNGASTPDSVALSITGDIDLRVFAAADDWSPVGIGELISKSVADNSEFSFLLRLQTTGVITLYWSQDGVNLKTANSTAAIATSNFSAIWIRATLDVDNGAGGNDVIFYTSADGTAWTQLGATVVVATAGAIYDSTAPVRVGTTNTGLASVFVGLIYRAQIYNGIAGTLAFDADFSTFTKLAPSGTESSANAATVTINTTGATGARISGARDLYQGTAANQPIYLPWSGTNYGYLNGVAGNYFSTPDSAAIQGINTNDSSWLVYLAPNAWTGATQVLIAKASSGAVGNTDFVVYLDTSGVPHYYYTSSDGLTTKNVQATAAVGFSAFTGGYVACTRNNSSPEVKFYTSSDGVTFTQLGTTVTTAGIHGNMRQVATPLEIGSQYVGTNSLLSGRVSRVVMWTGIVTDFSSGAAGTLVFDFNPSAYTSGTTFLDSAGGATITLNGGSTIVTRTTLYFDGSNDYLKAAAFAEPQPVTRLTAGSQVSWTSGDYLWDGASAANTGGLIQTTTTPQLNLNAGSSVAANTDFTLNTRFVFTDITNGASSSLQANRLTATTGNAGAGVPNGITIGASGAATAANFGNITFSERLEYGSLTAAQVVAAQLYLGRKWGIALP